MNNPTVVAAGSKVWRLANTAHHLG